MDMAPRSTGRSGIPKKPVSDRTTAFEQNDEQNHNEGLFTPAGTSLSPYLKAVLVDDVHILAVAHLLLVVHSGVDQALDPVVELLARRC
jgi:hypothetical protein